MNPPTTYAEWASLLNELKSTPIDEDTIASIYQGKLEFLPGVAERFTSRLTETVNARLERITANFNQTLRRPAADERALVTALRTLQKDFKMLLQLVKMPVLPEKFQEIYIRNIREEAKKLQTSLENSAKSDRSGKLSSIIRQHNINV